MKRTLLIVWLVSASLFAQNDYVSLPVVKQHPVRYPKDAVLAGTEGPVTLLVVVNPNGTVKEATAESGDEALRDAAVDSVKKWHFEPAIVNGSAVEAKTRVVVTFRLIPPQGYCPKEIVQKREEWTRHWESVKVKGEACNGEDCKKITAGVAAGRLLRHAKPEYPATLGAAGIQGKVLLLGTISKAGKLDKLCALKGHPLFVASALEAVRKWEYLPYSLKGEPVEVETEITVNFTLRR